jgi:hypothetical protein
MKEDPLLRDNEAVVLSPVIWQLSHYIWRRSALSTARRCVSSNLSPMGAEVRSSH